MPRTKLYCDQKDCYASYNRPQDLGRHLWFKHGIPGKHSVKNKKSSLARREDATATTPITENDLQIEGYSAFTAGQVYEIVRQRSETIGISYPAFASRVLEFVQATANGRVMGRPHRVSVLPPKTAA